MAHMVKLYGTATSLSLRGTPVKQDEDGGWIVPYADAAEVAALFGLSQTAPIRAGTIKASTIRADELRPAPVPEVKAPPAPSPEPAVEKPEAKAETLGVTAERYERKKGGR